MDLHKLKKGISAARTGRGVVMLLLFGLVGMLPPVFLARPAAGLLPGLPPWLVYTLLCLCWMVVMYPLGWVLFYLIRRHMMKKGGHRNMFDDAVDALDRIAQGDYSVIIEEDERFHYNVLADKINNLARQLCSMEQMRQDFVSNVSHEIQSPLTSISGFAQLLKKEGITPEERLHYIEVIESEAKRMSRLSDNLMRLSMLDSDNAPYSPAPFRLDRQLKSVLLAQEPQWAAKNLELDIDLAETTYNGDEDLLLQVWQNLLQNSIKFTPEGGGVHIALTQTETGVQCTMEDSGVGIPEEDLVHIFERFYKVDKARDRSMGGNGLGLPLAMKIVQLHGGRILVESEPGRGTRFIVHLPHPVNNE